MDHQKSPHSDQAHSEKKEDQSRRVAELEAKAEEYLNGWKRAKADYANLQKEVERRMEEFSKYANEALITELFPIADHFKQAFRHLPEELKTHEWVKGIEHLRTSLTQVLQSAGASELPTVGEKFDPARHEAIEEVESDQPSGTIVEEVRSGFMLNGKVAQAARVKVAK
ncbi:MAG: nucleotide exchange factor GrpE [bacterium]|nr:nucleotide exchange factor GrpE [bacterium]